MINHELKVAWRNLLKYKLQSVISITGLAVGLTCFVICNRELRDELMWNRRIPYADDIYVLTSSNSSHKVYTHIHAGVAKMVRDEFPEIRESVIYYNIHGYTSKMCVVEHENGTKTWCEEDFLYSDSSFIDFFGFRLLQGNREKLKNQPDALILTPSAALRIFGTTDAVGRIFTDIDDFSNLVKEYRVAVLMEEFPVQTIFENKAGLVLNATDKKTQGNMYQDAATVYFRLRSGDSYEALNEKLEAYAGRHPELMSESQRTLALFPFMKERDSRGGHSRWVFPFIFSGIGLLVLLAALFNYVLFMSGRILNRQKEYGIRQISGAAPWAIFRMFVLEITLTMSIVLMASLMLIELLTCILTEENSVFLAFDDRHNWIGLLGLQSLEYALIVWTVMVLICWLTLRRIRQMTTLRNLQGGGGVRYKSKVQNILLGLQLTICILFTGGAFFLYSQQHYLQKRLMGRLSVEECKRIYSFSLNGDKLEPIRADFKNMVEANPYIAEVCRSGNSLLRAWSVGAGYWQMPEIKEELREGLSFMYADASYPSFIHARMEEGRFYREDEPDCAVVNREFVRRWGVNPLGKEIAFSYFESMRNFRIVGIIEDVIPITEDPRLTPCIYLPYPDNHVNLIYYLKLKAGANPEVLEPLRAKMQAQVNLFTPLWIDTLDRDIDDSVRSIRGIGMLMLVLALVCVTISLLGIYSSMMLAVEKRSREMAIRKINGATIKDIARIFGRHYLLLLGVAALVAFPLLYAGVHYWLENYDYRISITVFPFAGIFIVLALIILLTIGSQLLRIIRIHPAEVLKSE